MFCSVGRRGELMKNFKSSLGDSGRIIATDCSNTAPALYFADVQYVVPKVTDENYITTIIDICRREEIRAITTFIDPEIEILSRNRSLFDEIGVELLLPYTATAELCFDKLRMYEFLLRNEIPTVPTYGNYGLFLDAYEKGQCTLPVFIKPRTGSGSVGARKITDLNELKIACEKDPSLIIQHFMSGDDLDADVYVDTISHQAVSAFTKRKLETRIGGANKTISFKDERLFSLIREIVSKFEFSGPIDMDFFYQDGVYYLSEINPRFGGAYLHAYGCGIDFMKLIVNNLRGIENDPSFGQYEDDVIMMMYDSVVIKRQAEMAKPCPL